MLTDWLRGQTRGVVESMSSVLHRLGLTPNAVTLIGMICMCGIGVLLAQGYLIIGGALMAIAASMDALDGGLARLTNNTSKFGAFLDSTTDRWAEAAIFGGLLWWYMQEGAQLEVMLVYAAIIGSLMVSYARARAEALGVECKVGIFSRFERLAVLGLGLLSNQMFIALVLLAVLANFTAMQRIWHVYGKIGK